MARAIWADNECWPLRPRSPRTSTNWILLIVVVVRRSRRARTRSPCNGSADPFAGRSRPSTCPGPISTLFLGRLRVLQERARARAESCVTLGGKARRFPGRCVFLRVCFSAAEEREGGGPCWCVRFRMRRDGAGAWAEGAARVGRGGAGRGGVSEQRGWGVGVVLHLALALALALVSAHRIEFLLVHFYTRQPLDPLHHSFVLLSLTCSSSSSHQTTRPLRLSSAPAPTIQSALSTRTPATHRAKSRRVVESFSGVRFIQ